MSLELRDKADYERFLAAQAAVIVPLEEWLTDHGVRTVLPDWPTRQRAEAITEDLAGLGSEPGRGAPLTARIDLAFSSVPALLGIAYVLEGSRLGAQYLSRIVAASPDEAVRNNMHFLEHGTGQRLWPTFLQTLETWVNDPAAIEEAIRGARATFDLFLAAQRRHAPVLAKASL